MSAIFINPVERRLRAFWRILVQFVLFFVLQTLLGIPVGIAIVALTGAGGNLTDPGTVQILMDHPYTRVANAVIALIAMVITYWVASRWMDRRPMHDFGFRFSANWWADLGFGLLLGALLITFIFVVELAAGWITIEGSLRSFEPGIGFWPALISSLIVFLCVGIYEEMLSRGYHLRNMAEGFNFRSVGPRAALLLAYLISSSIFGLLHLGNPNADWVSTFNIFIAGLFIGLGFILTGELAIPIGVHITWNFFQGNVFGFPVSGMQTPASFIAIQQGGPDLWTGGAFGPEAGLIGLVAMAIGTVLTILWVRWRYGRTQIQDRLASYTPPGSLAAQPEVDAPNPAGAGE